MNYIEDNRLHSFCNVVNEILKTHNSVLIIGASGTGKSQFAKNYCSIHEEAEYFNASDLLDCIVENISNHKNPLPNQVQKANTIIIDNSHIFAKQKETIPFLMKLLSNKKNIFIAEEELNSAGSGIQVIIFPEPTDDFKIRYIEDLSKDLETEIIITEELLNMSLFEIKGFLISYSAYKSPR